MMGESKELSQDLHKVIVAKLMALVTEGFLTLTHTLCQVPGLSLSPGLHQDVCL